MQKPSLPGGGVRGKGGKKDLHMFGTATQLCFALSTAEPGGEQAGWGGSAALRRRRKRHPSTCCTSIPPSTTTLDIATCPLPVLLSFVLL
eukprot:2100543-Rhodomonas_salina.7